MMLRCNRLDLGKLEPWSIMPKNLPGHCMKVKGVKEKHDPCLNINIHTTGKEGKEGEGSKNCPLHVHFEDFFCNKN